MVKKTGAGWAVYSSKGKKLSRVYETKKAAVERLREIEYFKHAKGK